MLIKLNTAIDREFEEPAPARRVALEYFQRNYKTRKVGRLWYVDLDEPLKSIENRVDRLIQMVGD